MNTQENSQGHGAATQLSAFSDDAIIREAANRLQLAFASQFGFPIKFGSFQLVFYNGKLQKVEDQFKNRRYVLDHCETEGVR